MDVWEVDYPGCQKLFSKFSSKSCQWILEVIQANLALKLSIQVYINFKRKEKKKKLPGLARSLRNGYTNPIFQVFSPPLGPDLDHFIFTPRLAHSCLSLMSQHKSCFLQAALCDPLPCPNQLFPYCSERGPFFLFFSFIALIIFVFFGIILYCLSPYQTKQVAHLLCTTALPMSTLQELSKCMLNE